MSFSLLPIRIVYNVFSGVFSSHNSTSFCSQFPSSSSRLRSLRHLLISSFPHPPLSSPYPTIMTATPHALPSVDFPLLSSPLSSTFTNLPVVIRSCHITLPLPSFPFLPLEFPLLSWLLSPAFPKLTSPTLLPVLTLPYLVTCCYLLVSSPFLSFLFFP